MKLRIEVRYEQVAETHEDGWGEFFIQYVDRPSEVLQVKVGRSWVDVPKYHPVRKKQARRGKHEG